MLSHTSIIIICVIALVFLSDNVHMKCTRKVPKKTDTRPGRCPHPQYAFSRFPCSAEGNDTVCPWDYKCCPLASGLACFGPCPEWSTPCNLTCQFGLKVSPSACTTCECASDPCLSTTCNKGLICVVEEYTPCWKAGTCGYKTRCVLDPSIPTGPPIKPNDCPNYWLGLGNGLSSYMKCNGSDSECPGDQKCCQAPLIGPPEWGFPVVSYCVDPCVNISGCSLGCRLGRRVVGGCQVCECIADPCINYTCPPGTTCRPQSAPCYYDPRSPLCRLVPLCDGYPSIATGALIKPNNCPDYWPGLGNGLSSYTQCRGSDSECPGDQKCCRAPPIAPPREYNPVVSCCVDPCVSISDCSLSCQFGLRVVGGCRVCECVVDPCINYTCPSGTTCRPQSAPCYDYPMSPLCRLIPLCIEYK